jgi:hypothetical protein
MKEASTKETGGNSVVAPKCYVLEQTLDSGANLRILIFESGEIKLIFKYKYCERPARGTQPTLINESVLEVSYLNGFISDCLLSMNIIVPPLLGKQFAWGVDISPGAKTYLEFEYKFSGGALCMTSVQIGAQRKIELNEPSDIDQFRHLIPSLFPLNEIIPLNYLSDYTFRAWFLHESGEKRSFEFMANIQKF